MTMTIMKKLREEERKECNEGLVGFVGVDGRGGFIEVY